MDDIEKRLKKVEGQIVGIQRMYTERRECMEIAQQIAAARAALASIGREILGGEAIRCSRSPKKQKQFEKMLEQLFIMS